MVLVTQHFLSQSKKMMAEIGDVMNVQVIIEGSMNSSNPYFSSSWRRDFTVSTTFHGPLFSLSAKLTHDKKIICIFNYNGHAKSFE